MYIVHKFVHFTLYSVYTIELVSKLGLSEGIYTYLYLSWIRQNVVFIFDQAYYFQTVFWIIPEQFKVICQRNLSELSSDSESITDTQNRCLEKPPDHRSVWLENIQNILKHAIKQ